MIHSCDWRLIIMKFSIVSRGDERSNEIEAKMKQYLIDFDLINSVEDPDLVISIGGDGTFLEAYRRYVEKLDTVAFLGIHTGHLGFYTDWTADELEKLVIEIAKTPFHVVEYPLLEVTIRFSDDEKPLHSLALNESTIKQPEGSVYFNFKIGGHHFEHLRVVD